LASVAVGYVGVTLAEVENATSYVPAAVSVAGVPPVVIANVGALDAVTVQRW
jgi:hypothetical protein